MVSFDVFYYKWKTKLTSAQHPARVHSSATPTPAGREGSRVPPPGEPARCLFYPCPSTSPSPAPAPLVRPPLPSPARRQTCRHPAAGGAGAGEKGPCRDAFGQKNSGAAPGEGAAGSQMRGAAPGGLPRPCPRNGPPGSRRLPGAQAVSALPGRFCATVARLLVFTADVFSLTQRLYSSWWPTAESAS